MLRRGMIGTFGVVGRLPGKAQPPSQVMLTSLQRPGRSNAEEKPSWGAEGEVKR